MIELNDSKLTFPKVSDINIQSDYIFKVSQLNSEGTLEYTYKPLYNLNKSDTNGNMLLSDFDTEYLNFSILHPLLIEIQKSYDNSVNIIFTDNYNAPRLINSRLAILDNNTYQIPTRNSNYDNVYTNDKNLFDIQTLLTKQFNNISTCDYKGFLLGGNLPCGNYHFYIAYADADGNSTNIIMETGLISVFLGNDGDPSSVHGGLRDTNSNKGVLLSLHNLNTAYSNLYILYTRDTSDDMLNAVTKYYMINKQFSFSSSETDITITGFENTLNMTFAEFNLMQKQFHAVKSITLTSNRLFAANILLDINQDSELKSVSIQILPYLHKINASDKIGSVNINYLSTGNGISNDFDKKTFLGEYYNSKNIYYNLGYANNELYRLGIIYIYTNGEESQVYNVRGGLICPLDENLTKPTNFTSIKWKNTPSENWDTILDVINEYQFTLDKLIQPDIDASGKKTNTTNIYENSAGVVYLSDSVDENGGKLLLYSIGMYIPKGVLQFLTTKGIMGFKFVRLKRIPMRLCQIFTLPVDRGSNLPLIHTKPYSKEVYSIESFITSRLSDRGKSDSKNDKSRQVILSYSSRLRTVSKEYVTQTGAICPDYSIKQTLFNLLFTGSSFKLRRSVQLMPAKKQYLTQYSTGSRLYTTDNLSYNTKDSWYSDIKIISLLDGLTSASVDNTIFRAKAGNAEEAYRYRLIAQDLLESDSGELSSANLLYTDLIVRGIFSPYLGLSGGNYDTYYDVYYPNWNINNLKDYINIRILDDSYYYPISDNIALPNTSQDYINNFYRGDNYFCTYTWRMNRNFSDSSAPTNDTIVESNTWRLYFLPNDSTEDNAGKTKIQYINRGDINAVKLGSWITVRVESNYNLNLRCIDDSNTTEVSLYGHGRGFYPIFKISADGGYKLPDSLLGNDGYNVSFGPRVYIRYSDTSYTQNIFSNRIYFSNVQPYSNPINNGYRIFKSDSFVDYNSEFGAITKILEWYGDLICVFEHGITFIPVLEKTIASDNSDIYINYNKILPDKGIVLTSDIGSKWIDSVIKTPYGIYGVDSVAKKIWKITGYGNSSKVDIISDFKIEQFLNENIDLGETDDLTVLGIRNICSHWNLYKSEIMFTFYDWRELYNTLTISEEDIKIPNLETLIAIEKDTPKRYCWNLAYNILSSSDGGIFTTFYSWIPSYVFNINLCMYSINLDYTSYTVLNYIGKQIKLIDNTLLDWSLITLDNYPDYINTINSIWKHGETNIRLEEAKPKPTHWYGIQHPFEFEFIVRDDPSLLKIWNNLYIISNAAEPESFSFSIIGDSYEFKKDKSNMYYRLEATKELWHNMGSKITYDKTYKNTTPNWNNTILNRYSTESPYNNIGGIPKSTYFPLYYKRSTLLNNLSPMMLDSYHTAFYDWKYLSGSEIYHNLRENNYGITTHIKCTPRSKYGILRANSEYVEDKWTIQIPLINMVQKNESKWDLPPLIIDYVPNDLKNLDITPELLPAQYQEISNNMPEVGSNTYWVNRLELQKWAATKLLPIRDKWIKIRIRYSGELLAIISAIRTVYTESYA